MLPFLLSLLLTSTLGASLPRASLPALRIIGGEETTIQAHPYLASLEVHGSHTCGAVIVNEFTVLTAAHCTHQYTAEILGIRAGTSNIETGGTLVDVTEIIEHPSYNPDNEQNDIAVLKLASALPLSSSIIPAELVAGISLPAGKAVVVAGWGVTEESSQTASPVLREVQLEIVDHDSCKNSYSSLREVTDAMICAGTSTGGKDACQGDSGGALVLAGTESLVGIVSWGYGCGRAGYPGVYTNVEDYIAWIFVYS